MDITQALTPHLIDNPIFQEVVVLGAVGYILRIFVKPNKTQVQLLARVITAIIILLVRVIRSWNRRHPGKVSGYVDNIYKHVFYSKHFDKNDTMIVG
jgi:hypothetical protein